jgi:thymidine kinase
VAKLYFRYGTMDSAKSMNLLAVAHNYRKQGKQIMLLKPRLDVRFGATKIASRSGLEAEADLMIDENSSLVPADFQGLDCILVDEAQFLSPSIIEDLRRITWDPGVPVICYGLRTDFKTRLFPGAQRLMELADRIEEVKVTCQYCAKKAICNLRLSAGEPSIDGPQIQLGGDEQYAPVCWGHYDEATRGLGSRSSGATVQ